jgi:PAS domain S-box-containing protein
MPRDEGERVASIFAPIMAQRKPFTGLANINQHRDGRLVVLETNGVPFFDTDGRFLGYRGIDRDITERKRVEEALRKAHDELEERVKERTADLVRTNLWLTKEIEERKRAEEALRKRDETLAEAQRIAHLGSYEWDPVADEIKGSEEAHRIFGIRREVSSITFNEFLELVHPDDRDSVNETARRSLADPGVPIAIEYRIIRPGGLEHFIYHRGEVTVAEHGKPVRVLGTVNDITDYKRAEEALRASEAQLRLMADSLPVLIAYVDREQRYQFNNLAYARWFGIPQDSLKGVSMRKVLGDHAYEGIRGYVEKALAGQDVQFETGLPTPGDPGRYVVAHYVPNVDRKGRVLGFYALVQDVTERRQIDLEIQRHREQLAHVSRVTTLGELTASLAHELHQPLAAIMSNAQAALRFLAQEDPDLDELRNILVDIVQDDRRASEVIQRLRQFLRRDKPELTPLELNGLIQEVMTLLKREAFLRGVTIDVELDAHLPPVVGDRIQLQQVVLNLVLNAADAMAELEPQSRKVIVQTTRGDDGEARVVVRDFGTGLDEQNLHCIFEPFYTTKPEGLGMGLAICRSIVDAHGGRLRGSNNPDGGATFIFTIPVSRGGEA